MNITLFIGGLSGGGAERVVCNLGNYLSKNHNVTILTMSNDKTPYKLSDNIERISLHSEGETKNPIIKNLKRISRLRKYLKNSKADTYVVMLPGTISLLLSFRKYIDAPIIVAERGDPSKIYNKSIVYRMIMENLFPKADNFVFQTKDAQKFYQLKLGTLEEGVVIPNAVNEEFLSAPFSGERSKKIVSIGRFTEQKNFPMLINAFSEISNDFPDYTLEIYGDGPLRKEMEALINKLNLTDKVFLPGYVENIKNHIEKASLFVLSSNFEGMPNALMEAMAMGIPSVSTDCPVGGPRYLIKDGINGFLVPVGDVKLLVNRMEIILTDKQIGKMFSESSKELTKRLHPEKIYSLWETTIKQTVNQR